jgi:hypothetical protein
MSADYVDIAAKVGVLFYKYKEQLEKSKKMTHGFTPEEASYYDGQESQLESVIDDLEEILFPKK